MSKNKPDSYYRKKASTFSPGEKVEVYHLIGCTDFKGIMTIKSIGSMNSSSESLPMIWFEEDGGAWHPGAVAKIREVQEIITDKDLEKLYEKKKNLIGELD